MRPTGGSGVQTHVRTFQGYLESVSRSCEFVNPFAARSPLLYPVFGARMVIRPVSSPAGVWWYRHWHAQFLAGALRSRLADGRPAIVYAQCPVSAGAALRARAGQRVVMAVHFNGSQAEEWANRGEVRRGGRLYRSIQAFEARVLPRLDGIAYVSAFARRVLEERLPALRDVRSVVIHNSVPAAPHRQVPRMADLVTIGALQSQKNHSYLLQVVADARDLGRRYTLSVIGDGAQRSRLEALAGRLGVADQVRFLGYRPDPRAVVAAHALYCHTAVSESFGIAALEAMAEGLPVLTGAVGALPELVRPGVNGGFWPLDDTRAAARVLIAMMDDRDALAAMGAAAATRARSDFSAEVLGARLLAFLDADAGARAPSRLPDGPVLPRSYR
ncbi:MAG TPA: glycosyltransferase family 4 protein [Sporichthyaceae bacterium]|nr:glycosyltransferase family 4 protein [Sporichthyaceae bacterium]